MAILGLEKSSLYKNKLFLLQLLLYLYKHIFKPTSDLLIVNEIKLVNDKIKKNYKSKKLSILVTHFKTSSKKRKVYSKLCKKKSRALCFVTSHFSVWVSYVFDTVVNRQGSSKVCHLASGVDTVKHQICGCIRYCIRGPSQMVNYTILSQTGSADLVCSILAQISWAAQVC